MRVLNGTGLHARPAKLFVETASRFRSRITVRKQGDECDGKSILGLMLLSAAQGREITIEAHGEDETEALAALAWLVEDRFGEAP